MPNRPLVSIIMNCFNCANYLKEAIDSVYAQSYENWEIIFWDNASTDDSCKIAQSYDNKLKYFRSPINTSLGEARNHALSKVTGKYLAFLDCDDIYLPEKLAIQVGLLESNIFVMVYSDYFTIDFKGDIVKKILTKNKNGYLFPYLLSHYEINMQSVMLKTSILDENGLNFNDSFSYCPDYYLFMQIAALYNIGVINQPLVKYRVHPNSLSNKLLDVVSCENKAVLNMLRSNFPELSSKYISYFESAYTKLSYYDSVALIYKSDYSGARRVLKKIFLKRWQYAILYFLLFIPFPKSFFMKMLNR